MLTVYKSLILNIYDQASLHFRGTGKAKDMCFLLSLKQITDIVFFHYQIHKQSFLWRIFFHLFMKCKKKEKYYNAIE